MDYRKLPAEGLKLIACLTMLMDHAAVVFHLGIGLRIIGRMAFPVYCFLLTEGMHYTRNQKKYMLRLTIAMILSELPFDLVFRGQVDWGYQNVLLTLLLGMGALHFMGKTESFAGKLLIWLPFLILSEVLRCDYGYQGVLMVLMFGLAREFHWDLPKTALGLALVSLARGSIPVSVLGIPVPVELFSLLAMVPLACYSGKKATDSRWVQWGFYLFYPVHLAILAFIVRA